MKLSQEAGVPFLGELPIDPRIAECGDMGDPIVNKYPDSASAKSYLSLASNVSEQIGKLGAPEELPTLQL
jgi:ATP-binding protein involved in chromosome partitioning